MHWWQGGVKGQKEANSLELELPAAVSHPVWMLGTELGVMQKQCGLLTTEPSLQVHVLYFS